MMRRARIRELALIAVAGGMLAFEVIGLRGALPVAGASLADGAGHAITHVAVPLLKGTATWLATPAPSRHPDRLLRLVSHMRRRGDGPRAPIVAVKWDRPSAAERVCRSHRRAHELRAADDVHLAISAGGS